MASRNVEDEGDLNISPKDPLILTKRNSKYFHFLSLPPLIEKTLPSPLDLILRELESQAHPFQTVFFYCS